MVVGPWPPRVGAQWCRLESGAASLGVSEDQYAVVVKVTVLNSH